MIDDARGVPVDARIKSEVCVVGGGPAGITIARSLAARGVMVVLLESGGREASWIGQDLYRGAVGATDNMPLDLLQLRYLGGNSNAWSGWCRPLDPIDFARRSWVEHSGWPISHAEFSAYLPRAEAICEIRTHGYDLSLWQEALGGTVESDCGLPEDVIQPSIYAFSPPVRFGQRYAHDLERLPSLRCLLHANVVGLSTSADGNRVEAVRVRTDAGNAFSIEAEHVVLAAGGIENARLLLASNDRWPMGLGNVDGNVGRYYMVHPHTKRPFHPGPRAGLLSLFTLDHVEHGVAGRLGLTPRIQERLGLLNYGANIVRDRPVRHGPGWQSAANIYQSLKRPMRKGFDPYIRRPEGTRKAVRAGDVARLVRHAPGMLWHSAGVRTGLRREPVAWYLESKPEQAPNPASRVRLDAVRDRFGVPRVAIEWRTSSLDRATLVKAEEMLDRAFRRLAIGQLGPVDGSYAESWPEPLWGGWHQMGTTRMAATPRDGVVDRDCRVFDLPNLSIAGQSVFPTGGAAPPTLTLLALALRLADRLVRDLRSAPVIKAPPPFEEAPAFAPEPVEAVLA